MLGFKCPLEQSQRPVNALCAIAICSELVKLFEFLPEHDEGLLWISQSCQVQNDLQHAEAIADAARHDREAAMAQASQAQNHLDQLSSTVQQLVQRNEQAAKVSRFSPLGVQPHHCRKWCPA